jgi:hypothetical protein
VLAQNTIRCALAEENITPSQSIDKINKLAEEQALAS